ncbi:MAG: hypothetical protein OEZ01_03870 [Candidatus Heimdallarchaeota archaeon]|nr:hypothetical protein [Candidatus Heimdallarchaeota archaeon]MDH5645116.1 hypothetical protein [Candidatus Heimdallarchaeota archaeon]
MLKQILVISPYGICPLYRNYDQYATDPHLIAGFVGAVIPHMQELGFTHEKIENEMIGDEHSYMEFSLMNSWIFTGIAEKSTKRERVKSILSSVNNVISNKLDDYDNLLNAKISFLNELEEEIDIVVAQKGISTYNTDNNSGYLPIIQRVQNGTMKTKKAAQLLLDSLKDEIHDDQTKQNILASLKMLDQLMSIGGKKLDEIGELIRATYKNVSKYIVRLDHAMDF